MAKLALIMFFLRSVMPCNGGSSITFSDGGLHKLSSDRIHRSPTKITRDFLDAEESYTLLGVLDDAL